MQDFFAGPLHRLHGPAKCCIFSTAQAGGRARAAEKGEEINMDKTSNLYQAYVQILKEELIPAMGCTEPIAIAYAAAKARQVLGCLPDAVRIGVSSNIIKNVKSVIVPNTDGMKGIEAAAAAGIVAGQADRALEVISQVTAAQQAEIGAFLEKTPVEVRLAEEGKSCRTRIPYEYAVRMTVN